MSVSKGTRVWVHTSAAAPGGTAAWTAGSVVAVSGAKCQVALDCEAGEAQGPVVSLPVSQLEHANPELLDGVRCACRLGVTHPGW